MKSNAFFLLLTIVAWGGADSGHAATIAVSGVVLDANGERADGAMAFLGYAPGHQGPVRDQSAPAGVFALIRINADNILKVYVVIEGDSLHEDTSHEVSLRPMPGDVLLGKPGEIRRIKRPPDTASLPYLSQDEARNRLKNLEEAQAVLVIGGHRSEEDAQADFSTGAARILANVQDDRIDPSELLKEAQQTVDQEIGAEGIITDRIRAAIPAGATYRGLRANRLDPSALLRQPETQIPDDIVDVLRDLPGRDLPAEWLSGDLAERVVERHTREATGRAVIGAFPAGRQPAAIGPDTLLLDPQAKGSREVISQWIESSEEARRAVLVEALREHPGVSREKRNELDRDIDLPQLNVLRVSP